MLFTTVGMFAAFSVDKTAEVLGLYHNPQDSVAGISCDVSEPVVVSNLTDMQQNLKFLP